MNRLLKKQISRHLGERFDQESAYRSKPFQSFLDAVDASYEFYRREQALLERTLELNSEELNEANRRLLEQNEAISRLATTDTLTGLPNRRVCHDRVAEALRRASRHDGLFSLLFIDLDRFKTINDTLGHQAGDKLLKDVALRLTNSVRKHDMVSRLGGDEFTVLLEDISDANEAHVVAQKILDRLAEPYSIDGKELSITASIGIGIYPTNGNNIVDIFKHADTAMYFVKENGRNNFQSYDPEMHQKVVESMEIESNLRSAIANNELSVHYQPKLDMKTGRIVGCEALLRWRSQQHGQVPPGVFIPIAESSGYITKLGDWVLSTACGQNRLWQEKGLRPVPVAVNISAIQLQHPDFLKSIDRVLHESGLAPEYLELEITESTIMGTEDIVMENLTLLKNRGIRLSIDDFGTGYSSLSKLKQFPIDSLKIDRSFVCDIADDPDDLAIVTAIIAMADSLKLNVIAEGVETVEQLKQLIDRNCTQIQGYWFSRPLADEDFENLLASDPLVEDDPVFPVVNII